MHGNVCVIRQAKANKVGISDHIGKSKPFSSEWLVTETKKNKTNAEFAEFSSRNKVPSFRNLTFLFMCMRAGQLGPKTTVYYTL